MSFQPKRGVIRWKMHFASAPAAVYQALATDAGRARYWAEAAPEENGVITFHILGYEPFCGGVLERCEPSAFAVEYFGTVARFALSDDAAGGTDLSLVATGVDESIRSEMTAGWVSVLMGMKAAVDHGVDLRNHDAARSWKQGYADN